MWIHQICFWFVFHRTHWFIKVEIWCSLSTWEGALLSYTFIESQINFDFITFLLTFLLFFWLYYFSFHDIGRSNLEHCDNLQWWDGVGGSLKREGTYVCLWLIHTDIWQKPTQYYKAIKKNNKKNKITLLLNHNFL